MCWLYVTRKIDVAQQDRAQSYDLWAKGVNIEGSEACKSIDDSYPLTSVIEERIIHLNNNCQ